MHGVSFALAQHAFGDPDRVIAEDVGHSKIRIIGAGCWRKEKNIYYAERP